MRKILGGLVVLPVVVGGLSIAAAAVFFPEPSTGPSSRGVDDISVGAGGAGPDGGDEHGTAVDGRRPYLSVVDGRTVLLPGSLAALIALLPDDGPPLPEHGPTLGDAGQTAPAGERFGRRPGGRGPPGHQPDPGRPGAGAAHRAPGGPAARRSAPGAGPAGRPAPAARRRVRALDALRRHESELLAVYLLHRLGTAQRHLIDLLRGSLEQVIATDPRLAGRDADRTAHTLYLAVQGAVLSGPLAAPLADPRAWRAELDLLVRGYLRI